MSFELFFPKITFQKIYSGTHFIHSENSIPKVINQYILLRNFSSENTILKILESSYQNAS